MVLFDLQSEGDVFFTQCLMFTHILELFCWCFLLFLLLARWQKATPHHSSQVGHVVEFLPYLIIWWSDLHSSLEIFLVRYVGGVVLPDISPVECACLKSTDIRSRCKKKLNTFPNHLKTILWNIKGAMEIEGNT